MSKRTCRFCGVVGEFLPVQTHPTLEPGKVRYLLLAPDPAGEVVVVGNDYIKQSDGQVLKDISWNAKKAEGNPAWVPRPRFKIHSAKSCLA